MFTILKNLSIKQKLYSGFSAIIAITLGLAIYSFFGVKEMDAIAEKNLEYSKAQIYANNIIDRWNWMQLVYRDYVRADDPEKIDQFVEKRKKYSAEINVNLDSLSALDVDAKIKSEIVDFAAYRKEKTLPALAQLESYAIANEDSLGELFMDGEMESIIQEAQAKINQILADVNNSSFIELQKADVVAGELTIALVIAAFVALVVGGLISTTIANLISKPIVKLQEIIQELAKGHLKSRSGIVGKDEIAQMAGLLDSFIEKMELFAHEMDKVAAGDANVYVEPADSADMLTPALNRMSNSLKNVINESKSLIGSANAGDLSVRGDDSKFSGGFYDIIHGFNELLDTITEPIKLTSEALKQVASGDLTVRITKEFKGDFVALKNSVNELGYSLQELIGEVMEVSKSVSSASNEISSSTEQMAAGAQEQSSQTSEVASAIQQMASTIVESTRNTNNAASSAKSAGALANEGGKIVSQTVEGMRKIAEVVNTAAVTVEALGESSNKIGEIVQVIDDIADQTNLLALNAAIEAARAGEQGRGFAVVADEVRKLAERTTKATKEIAVMIKTIQRDTTHAVGSIKIGTQEVSNGTMLAQQAGESMSEIVSATNSVVQEINNVASASEQQASAAEQVTQNVEGINTVANESALGIQQISRAATELSSLTGNLDTLVGRFKITDKAPISKSRTFSNKRSTKYLN